MLVKHYAQVTNKIFHVYSLLHTQQTKNNVPHIFHIKGHKNVFRVFFLQFLQNIEWIVFY